MKTKELNIELLRLQLHYAWAWSQANEDAIKDALKERVDLARKFDPSPKHYDIAELNFESAGFIKACDAIEVLYFETKSDKTSEQFENKSLAYLKSPMDLFIKKTYGSKAKKLEYQAGSLKFDPAKDGYVEFHIANLISPKSIFDDPLYLVNCFENLMDMAEDEYGAVGLFTHSWLNSLPKWQAYFPREWHENTGAVDTNIMWHFGFWGQLLSAKETFNYKYARRFRETGNLPFYPCGSRCSFENMRAHLKTLK